jgi:hypothetical protein
MLAKVALLIGRSAILIFSHRWLSTTEFALIAATLSCVDISYQGAQVVRSRGVVARFTRVIMKPVLCYLHFCID